MRRVFSKLLYEMEEGRDTVLVTVTSDRGSAPRGSGAEMLVGRGGRLAGSIGGGAVEFRAEAFARECLAERKSAQKEFVLREDRQDDIGMRCGGDVTVLFAYVPGPDTRWRLLAGAVCDRIQAGESGWLVRPLDGNVPSLYGPAGRLAGEELPEDAMEELFRNRPVCGNGYFSQPLPQPGRVVIFGGGHIAQALVPLLQTVDFRSVVLDNRPEYADPRRFPEAEEVLRCNYENIAGSVDLTGDDYVIIMTNGHAYDLTVEEQVLRGSCAYLGVIGSRSKIAFVNRTLADRGVDQEKLRQVHTPIGLPIRAVTPAEIAVSILAELILCRARIRDGQTEPPQPCPMS